MSVKGNRVRGLGSTAKECSTGNLSTVENQPKGFWKNDFHVNGPKKILNLPMSGVGKRKASANVS